MFSCLKLCAIWIAPFFSSTLHPKITEEIKAAAEHANVAKFIDELPQLNRDVTDLQGHHQEQSWILRRAMLL
ncbi:hypothetical protein SCA6_019320 [Theobroma cacao]